MKIGLLHAIVRQGNGKYYVSAVFGCYEDITAKDDGYKYNETPEIRTQKDMGDFEYDTSSRHSEEWIPYWTGSTLILRDGFVYFVDEYIDADDITEDKLKSGYYCYFKARHMKYRIIPD